MSNGKKFFLTVVAIVMPFMLVFGIVLGVLIAKGGGGSKPVATYTSNSVSNSNTESQILGVWNGIKNDSSQITERLEFFNDGTFLYSTIFEDKGDSIDLKGRYSFSGTNRIKFEYTSGHIKGDTKIGDVSIDGNNMKFDKLFGFISSSFIKGR